MGLEQRVAEECHAGQVLEEGRVPGCHVVRGGPLVEQTLVLIGRALQVRTDFGNYPPAISAIQPNRQVTDRSQVAYGRAEVERYLDNNPCLLRGVPGGPSPKLGTVEFLPADQASARLNNVSIGRPDDVLVCWVELIGPLDVSDEISVPAFVAAGSPNIPYPPAPKKILLFDAQNRRSGVYLRACEASMPSIN